MSDEYETYQGDNSTGYINVESLCCTIENNKYFEC